MPSSSSTTSTVVGGLCGSGLGMALTYVPSTTRASRAILRAPMASSAPASLTAVRGISVGHWTDLERATGCSVVLGPERGMRAACAVRGRATGTRELDALNPRHVVDRIDAILLTGGSAFGLGAADGVMRWLKERGRGLPVGSAGIVPIVPTAVIFDFDLAPGGKADRWPTADDAYRACTAASADVVEGSVGAGTGATVGKALGPRAAMKGGVGSWAASGGDIVVGALVVLNAVGNILGGARGRRHIRRRADAFRPGGRPVRRSREGAQYDARRGRDQRDARPHRPRGPGPRGGRRAGAAHRALRHAVRRRCRVRGEHRHRGARDTPADRGPRGPGGANGGGACRPARAGHREYSGIGRSCARRARVNSRLGVCP